MSYGEMLKQAQEITGGYVGKIAIASEMETYCDEIGLDDFERLCEEAYRLYLNNDYMSALEAVEEIVGKYANERSE